MTLLPNKHVPADRSLFGIGTLVLRELNSPSTVSRVWDRLKEKPEVGSYRVFVLALSYLYAVGAVEYSQGLLSRTGRNHD